jgi:uncharacterized membrane protein
MPIRFLRINSRIRYQIRIWYVPAVYIFGAILLSRLVPLLDINILGEQILFSPETSTSLLSAISSGMIAFTGFVFSMAFVMIQSVNTTYSPRLAGYFIQDNIVRHSLGMFIATFVYALLTLSMVDLWLVGHHLDYAILLVLLGLLGSMVMFLALVQRFAMLQVTHVLKMVGDRGRKVIEEMYETPYTLEEEVSDPEKSPVSQLIRHHGAPLTIMTIALDKLARQAEKVDCLLELYYAVGDTVAYDAVLLSMHGGKKQLNKSELKNIIEFGSQRTIEQDPKYAIRLIVDVAIRALSPALNDPSTAVQALDQIDDLLRRIGGRKLEVGQIKDEAGVVRLVYPTPCWEDFLSLAFDEIRMYGATSLQVMRRLRTLLEDLEDAVPLDRKEEVRNHLESVNASIKRNFSDLQDRMNAQTSDRQGIGLARPPDDDNF